MSTSNLVERANGIKITMPHMTIGKNLSKLRGKSGLSQAALAKVSGVSQQLISQIEKDKNTSTKYLPKLANALGVQVSDIDPEYSGPSTDIRMVRVLGYVQAGAFETAWEWPEDEQFEVPIQSEDEFRGYALFGVQTRGASMNRRYPEGTVLIFTNAIHTLEDIKPGQRYIVERHRPDGTVEATVKLLWQDEHGKPWLLPESTDPFFQEPISLDDLGDDTVRIIGQVRYAVSREG